MKRLYKILAGLIALLSLVILSAVTVLFNRWRRRRNDPFHQELRRSRPAIPIWSRIQGYQSLPDVTPQALSYPQISLHPLAPLHPQAPPSPEVSLGPQTQPPSGPVPPSQAPSRPKAPPPRHTPSTGKENKVPQSISKPDIAVVQPESSNDLRKRADTEGDAMRRAFESSRVARRTNQVAKARQLEKEGREHQSEVDRLNHEASAMIFCEMNRPGKQPQGTIDLHGGLRVKEAEEHTTREIEDALQRGDAEMRIIVGQGLHASDGVAKIRPAIEKLLRNKGIVFERDPTNAGELVVQLKHGNHSRKSVGLSSRI